jgi:hypothetical protein
MSAHAIALPLTRISFGGVNKFGIMTVSPSSYCLRAKIRFAAFSMAIIGMSRIVTLSKISRCIQGLHRKWKNNG